MEHAMATKNGQVEITLRGRLTFTDNPAFKGFIKEIESASQRTVVFDLGGLEFIDSAGLGMFLLARTAAIKSGVHLILRRPAGQVDRVFSLSKFETLFKIES